jgi:hypothetical protein
MLPMKKIALLLTLATVVMAAAGAAQAGIIDRVLQSQLQMPRLERLTSVIPPGHKVEIDGKTLTVVGTTGCPQNPVPGTTDIWVIGTSSDMYRDLYAGQSGCIVVGPTTTSVDVKIYADTGLFGTESWTVERKQINGFDSLQLKRPNGDYVTDGR